MKKHLFLFILTLAVLSVSNAWADCTNSMSLDVKMDRVIPSACSCGAPGNLDENANYYYYDGFFWDWKGSNGELYYKVTLPASTYSISISIANAQNAWMNIYSTTSSNNGNCTVEGVTYYKRSWHDMDQTYGQYQGSFKTETASSISLSAGTYIIGIYGENCTAFSGLTITAASDVFCDCTAPNHVDISGTWHIFPGDDLELTARAYSTAGTSNEITEGLTYQWQKYTGSSFSDIDGATSATYTKTNAGVSDAGQYRCRVSTGGTIGDACTTASAADAASAFKVKSLELLVYYNDNTFKHRVGFNKVDDTHATVSVLLENGTYKYTYKITDSQGKYWGNNGASGMTSSNCTNWSLTQNNDYYTGLTTTKGYTTYIFNLTYNAGLDEFYMSVIYPSTVQTGGYNIYFDNSKLDWDANKIYYRIGRSNYNSKSAMTLVPGTDSLYTTTTIHYESDGGFEAWHIANNGCWSESSSIYKTKTGDGWQASEAMRFEGAPVSSSGISILPNTSSHWEGTGDADDCEFYSYDSYSGLLTHTATITTPTNGTIQIAYNDKDHTDEANKVTQTSTTAGLAHRTKLYISTTPATGYEQATLTVNGSNFDASYHVLSANATIAATFSPKSCTVTFDKEGGSDGSNNVTATYDAAMPDITAPTKTGYTFGGYWDGDNGTGTQYYNADGTSARTWDKNTTSETPLYAKWTAKTTTVSFDQNSGSGGQTSSLTATYGSAMPTPITAPTRTGYDFDGYYDGAGGAGTKYYNNDGTSAKNWDKENATWTLSAKWTAKSYTVTLNTNDGTINAGDVTSYTYGVGATLPTNVTKSGNRFMGWYDNSSFTGSPVTTISTSTTGNKEYWARWATLYTITNGNPSNGTITVNSTAIEGETVSILATPSSGYALDEWSIYKTGGASTTIDPASATASTTFTMPAYGVTVTATFAEISCWSSRTYQVEDIMITTAGAVTNHDTQATPSNVKIITSENQNYDSNTDDYFASISDGAFVYNTQVESAVYMEVDVPSVGNYTLDVYSGKGKDKNVWVNVYTTTYVSGDNISYGGTTYYKQYYTQLNKDYSTYAIKLSDKNGGTGVDNKAYPAGKCIIGIYTRSANCALDKIVLTRVDDSEVFCKHTITVNNTSGASSSATADISKAFSGETVTVTAYAASDGYRFTGWTATSGTVTFANASLLSTTFVMPDENVTVQANYVVDTKYTVHYEVVGGNGTVSAKVKATSAVVSDGDQIASGTTLTFTATPSSGYSVLGWYTYASSTETYQDDTRATNTFDYELTSDMTIRVKFTKIRIATGDANLGSTDGYANSNDGSTIATSNVDDPEGKFNHKVLQVDYKMVSASDQASYRGISLPVDAGYTTSIASGKAGMGFWYRTASTNDQVLMYFCIGGTDGSHQFESLLPATNQKWQYWYIATDYIDDNTTFGFYINGTKNGKSSGVIGSSAKVWLSEVEPLTPADVTVDDGEPEEIAPVVRDLTIYQGSEVSNAADVIVTRNIYYHRHAKGGALTNKLDKWYTFAVPFTVSGIEVKESSTWYAINAVHYTTNGDQSSEPDGPGHFYLQYLKNDTKNQMTNDRWMYINPAHSEYIDADTEDWDGYRYGYPKKDSAYIILFDSTDPIGDYFETNTEIRFVGGPQTIAATAWTPEYDTKETEYWMYANNTLHSITLTNDAYVLNESGTTFVLEEEPTIRPFECYIQATEEFKLTYASIPMRRPGGNTPTAIEDIESNDTSRTIKVLHQGHLIIIRNGHSYDIMGARVR